MDKTTAIHTFSAWDRQGRYVFTHRDLSKLFPHDKPKALQEGVNRLVRAGLLQRACRGVYVYTLGNSPDSHTIERIAVALRRGEYSYLSLESALSEYGAISQIPLDRLTVMTTGRKGEYRTPWGVVEFTHTQRSVTAILDSVVNVGRPLRVATLQTAWRDLKRVGRNVHLVDREVVDGD